MSDSVQANIELIRSDVLTDRAPYAYAAVVDAGVRLVFTAGACPLSEDGHIVAPGDFTAQAAQTLRNLDEALRAAGSSRHEVVKSTVYVATSRREDLTAVWGEVASYFGNHDAPSTLLGVALLGYEDQLVEVEVVAAQT